MNPELDTDPSSSNIENRTSIITITQTNHPAKPTIQSSVQISAPVSQPLGSSASSNAKLSPIKMVQPLGFPTKLPPPPPQYQTSYPSSSGLLKTTVPTNKDQKAPPPIR